MKSSCVIVVLLALASGACSGSAPAPGHPAGEGRRARGDATLEAANGGFPGDRFASVPPGTFGPYLGTRPDGMVAAWAAAEDGKRHWFTAALGPSGMPLAAPLPVADAAPEVNLVALRPAGAAGSGFFLLATSREFSGERIDVMGLGPHGELRGDPTPLALSLPDVVWIDVVPTKRGATAMWAVRREDRADLYGTRLGETGGPEDRSSELLRDVRAWQVTETPDGIAIAAALAGKEVGERGPLVLCLLGTEAQVEKKVLLSDGATVEPDVDLTRMGERLLVAWSDKANVDPRITGVVVDVGGNVVTSKRPIAPSFGPQSLVRLVLPRREGSPAYVAWENALEKPRSGRTLRVGAVRRDLTVGQASAIVTMASEGALPEFAATERGVAVLTTASLCERGLICSNAPRVPTFAEIDAAMRVVTSEPIRLKSLHGKVADMAWGLSCTEGACLALAAAPSNPAPVYVVKLGGSTAHWEAAVRSSAEVPAPRADEVEAVAKSEGVARMAMARIGSSQVISWVTYLDPATPFAKLKKPAPDGKLEAPRALLRVQNLPDNGPPAEPTTISYRAHSPGGVAMAPGEPGREEALLVWSGVDERQPQVFLTLLGPGGKKTLQKMLTHGRAAVSNVAAAFTGDGWAVAWVDERGGSPQIHIAKVDRKLSPIVRERPLLASRSAQAGVALLPKSDHLFVTWSDGRGGGSADNFDIYALKLSSKDLSTIGPEHAVAATPLRSRSPAMAALGEGAVVAWVEDPNAGSMATGSTILVARLDSGAEVVDTPATVRVEGSPEGVGIVCGKAECRIATSVFTGEGGDIEAFEWAPGKVPRAASLLPLGARLRETAVPVFLGQDLLYVDERRAGDARLRRVRVTWR